LPIGRETGNFLPASEVSVHSTSCPSSQKGATSAQVVSAGVQEKLPIGRETGNFLPASEVSVHSTSCPSSQKGATSAQGVSPQVHHKLPVENEGGNFLPASPDVAFPETGNFSSAHPEHGQLLPSTLKKLPVSGNFSDSAIVNANGNIYNNNNNTNNVSVNDITSSDRHTTKEAGVVGQRLAHFLEKSPANIGGYVNKAKQCTRTVIRAAIVDLLVHQAFPTIDPIDERGRPRHRGRWFHDACNRYSVEGLIPAYVMRWVQTDLSWQEIEQELATLAIAYQSYMVASHETAEFVRGYLRGEIDKQGLDQALQDLKMPAQSSTDGVARPIRMIEWKGRMVPEEQAYREGYYGGFERFLPGDHPDDDLLAVVERLRAEGKLILPPPRNGVHNG